MTTPSIDSLLKLPKKRRMEIAERLWLSATDEQNAPVPAAHRKTVASRLTDYQAGKTKPVAHETMMGKLRAR